MRTSVAFREGVGALTAVALLAGYAPAAAQEPQTLRDALFGAFRHDDRRAPMPTVARYRGEEGESFILDRSGGAPLMRFDDSPEIWVLKPTPGPRGDVIYRNDVGDPVLRAMRVGGLTLFTSDRPTGMAAALAGGASILRPALVSGPAQLFQILLQASARASRIAQHRVEFNAPDVSPGEEPVFADAMLVTAQAFGRLVAGRGGRSVVARFVRVRFDSGHSPEALVFGHEVRIVVSPKDGVAGRPSSRRIAMAMAGH